MLTVLVITGSLLPGAGIGVKYYAGSIDTSKFFQPSVWKDAVRKKNYLYFWLF